MENKTLEELLAENAILNDKRRKVFKELRSNLINTYIPSLCQVLKDCEKEATFITLSVNPFCYSPEKENPWHDEYYILCIKADGTLREGYLYDEQRGIYKSCVYVEDDDVNTINSKCIVELCGEIKKKIRKFNKSLETKISSAEEMLLPSAEDK